MDMHNGLNKNSLINGIIQILLSIFWIWQYGILLYQYNYTDILFNFMHPNWTLILYILMGVSGIIIGLSVLFAKKKIKTGYFQIFRLLIIGIVINLIIIA